MLSGGVLKLFCTGDSCAVTAAGSASSKDSVENLIMEVR